MFSISIEISLITSFKFLEKYHLQKIKKRKDASRSPLTITTTGIGKHGGLMRSPPEPAVARDETDPGHPRFGWAASSRIHPT